MTDTPKKPDTPKKTNKLKDPLHGITLEQIITEMEKISAAAGEILLRQTANPNPTIATKP